ncbi:MAG TPA: helix-turn-helix domain-containing protein [Steroidobacteraceae bacterium]|nr:helix-turn-helix domain-containing protein [Steroidobacteraceae bacterium]
MAERTLLVAELKRALRERGLTYVEVARALGLSLATIKRRFARGDFSLERFERICELADVGLRDLLERAEERSAPTRQLTLVQEREIVADPRLFLVTWLVLNRTPFEEITRSYRFTERELLRYFIRLDRLKVIELQPANRTRLLVSRRFSWRAGGPVQRYLHQRLLREFLASSFTGAQEEFVFHGATISREVLAQLKRVQQNASRECMELIEQDRSPRQGRIGAAFVLALRPWSYTGFVQFERR